MPKIKTGTRVTTLSVEQMILVAGVAILSHASLLATDHVIWDGWWFNADLGDPLSLLLDRQLTESGKPVEKVFLLPFRALPSFELRVTASKIVSVACWVLSFVLMAISLRSLARLPDQVALAVPMLAAAAPCYDVLGDTSLWMHVACVCLFWLAWSLLATSVGVHGLRHAAVRSTALVLFTISFTLNSLLVYFYAVAVCLAILRTRAQFSMASCLRVARGAGMWVDFLAAPIVYWFLKAAIAPTSGYYTNYNKPNLHPAHLLQGLANTVATFLVPTVIELISPVSLAVLAAISGGLLGVWMTRLRAFEHETQVDHPLNWRLLGCCGMVLFLGASIPYVAVGQPIASYGWWSRNGILMPLPMAAIAVAAAGVANRWIPTRPTAWLVLTAMLTGLFASSSIRNYMTMQGYGAKQFAMRNHLRSVIETDAPAIIQLRDYSSMRGTNEGYPPSIWTYIASDLNEKPRTLVVETSQSVPDSESVDQRGQRTVQVGVVPMTSTLIDSVIQATGMPYALGEIPRSGGQSLLVIRSGSHTLDGCRVGWEYLRRRWLEPASLRRFLDELVTAESYQLPQVTE